MKSDEEHFLTIKKLRYSRIIYLIFFSILSFSAGTIGTLVGVYWGLPSSIKYGLVLFLSTSYELKIFTN